MRTADPKEDVSIDDLRELVSAHQSLTGHPVLMFAFDPAIPIAGLCGSCRRVIGETREGRESTEGGLDHDTINWPMIYGYVDEEAVL